jgi:Mg2+-importing ATPase
MVVFGLISSLFDVLTFLVLLRFLMADEATFQTGWFVVSLLTELAVLLVLRTKRPALKSHPGGLLWRGVSIVGLIALALPYVPGVAALFGLVPLSPFQMAILLGLVGAYLWATELTKVWFFRSYPPSR